MREFGITYYVDQRVHGSVKGRIVEARGSDTDVEGEVQRLRSPSGMDFALDVRRDRRGEFFEIRSLPDSPLAIKVLDTRPSLRHLLLPVQEGGGKHRFLCGHDERHWFVAAIPENSPVSTVRSAMEALKPAEVQKAQASRKVKTRERLQRRTDAYTRQGEWFFVPAPTLKVDPRLVLLNEPLARGAGSRPHIAERCYRKGGVTVYVSPQHPQGLSEEKYKALIQRDPKSRKWSWRTMRRNPEVYVMGKVRHGDHKTVVLPFWHRVMMNTENQSLAMRNVASLD